MHPNKFLPNLRPIEDFRHTPIIPISQKDIQDYAKKVEERNRKGYYVEIKKDTIAFYTIAIISMSVVFYTFLVVNDKQMRIKQDIERTRTLKLKASSGREGIQTLEERRKDNLVNNRSY